MAHPADIAALFRDVIAAGTAHQRTLQEQTGDGGLLVRCGTADHLPRGVTSPYLDAPDRPGPFLEVSPAGERPARPEPDSDGVVPEHAQREYEHARQAWHEHRQLYDDLFAARTPSEQQELIVAVGLLQHSELSGDRHQRHVVAAPAEIELDQSTQRLTVVASDAFRVEHNWLAGELRSPLVEALDSRSNRPLLEVLADDAETYAGACETWQRARSVFGQDTRWEATTDAPPGVVSLAVEPAVLLRKKDTSHLLALLTAMAEDLADGGHVTGPLRMLVDMTARVDQLPTRTDRPALARAANDEQRSMLDHARRSPHSVIQGPPGTGKTHTIANLAAVLMAEGRRVLITAENDRALREVQDKLPEGMQPLLLPLLKDKAASGLSRSVTSLIEEADKQRRGARPDLEGSLTAKRDALEEDAQETVDEIRRLDTLEKQEHVLNGQRMRLAGHMIALDGARLDLAKADHYLSSETADPQDAQALLELQPLVSETDRELTRLRLPTGLPDPASFAQQLQQTREQLSQIPERTEFDYARLDARTIEHLENVGARLSGLPRVSYTSIDRTPGEYRGLADDARAARASLNHGVTANGARDTDVCDYLDAYIDLPGYYTDEPSGIIQLYRRAERSSDAAGVSIGLAASADPVATYNDANEVSARFRGDPTGGLLNQYVTDVRRQGETRLESIAQHARQLVEDAGIPPTPPIMVVEGSPSEQDLLEQARVLQTHLSNGGKMSRPFGTPRAVKQATPLIEHVTVGGARIDTTAKAEAVATWLQHRTGVSIARHWAAQHGLQPPTDDARLQDWLSALARLPEAADSLSLELAALLRRCHVPPAMQSRDADDLASAVAASSATRVVQELSSFVEAYSRLGDAQVRVDGVEAHDTAQARVARDHFRSMLTRNGIADRLPPEWTRDRDLHQPGGEDPLASACDAAAAAADLPGPARPQTLSDTSIRDVLARAQADRRRQEITGAHTAFLNGIWTALSICTPASPATDLLADAIRAEDPSAYREAHRAHVDELERAQRAERLHEVTTRLQQVHPRLVAAFLSSDDDASEVLARLGHFQQLLAYRREAHALLERYPDVRELHTRLADLRSEHLRVESSLASARCWARAVERLAQDRELAAALASLQQAESAQLKTRTAKGYQRKLRAMRRATRAAAPAIPCWVMPIEKVAELLGYPTEEADRFDVVIIDEASQAWFPSAFLYAIAEQVIVVGDDLQTSPSDTSVTHDEMVRMTHQHIPNHKLRDAIDGRFSLYDIARAITGPSVMVDHFRCVPPIIELSNSLCYAQRNQRLQPVRVTEPDALTPLEHVRVSGERTSAAGANIPEIEALVQKAVTCVADDRYDDLSFGVVVVGPNPYAHIKQLRSSLLQALGSQQMAQRQIEVGSPAQYQGAERNIMFLSLVDTPDRNGNVRQWPHELSGKALRQVQNLNVAVSRAQDQLWIFHSFGPEHLKPGDVRHVLLTPPATDDSATLEAQLAKCASNFERDVAEALAAHPDVAKLRTQVEALGRRIDIVIESYDGRRLAVECDGDRFHTSDGDVAKDLYRQRTLETAGGWKFQRFLASEWYADSDRLREQTVQMLGAAPRPELHPIEDSKPDVADTPAVAAGGNDASERERDAPIPRLGGSSATELASESAPRASSANSGPPPPPVAQGTPAQTSGRADNPPKPPDQAQTARQPRLLGDHESLEGGQQPREPSESAQKGGQPANGQAPQDARISMTPAEAPAPPRDQNGNPLNDLTAVYATAEPYRHWDTSISVPNVQTGRSSEIVEALRRIVEVEGPIIADRLYKLYNRSMGGSRVGPDLRRQFNRTTARMERRRILVADNPLGETGQKPKTFRLPDQHPLRVRERGDRSLHEIPPLELAARIRALRRVTDSRTDTYRRVLHSYGLTRLTDAAKARMDACVAQLDALD